MRYLDKYPDCRGCPVIKYCGKAVSTIRLCNSYSNITSENTSPKLINSTNLSLTETI